MFAAGMKRTAHVAVRPTPYNDHACTAHAALEDARQQYTKSTLQLGQKMHKAYKAGLVNGVTRFKEYAFNTGRRADFIDFENGIIYELKPNNPRAIREGYRQLQKYLADAKAQFPDINWQTVLDVY